MIYDHNINIYPHRKSKSILMLALLSGRLVIDNILSGNPKHLPNSRREGHLLFGGANVLGKERSF